MKKLVLTLVTVGAFSIGSAFAGSCGGCGGKDKGGKGDKGGAGDAKESLTYVVEI
jgi:hypothetical protein